MSDEQEAPPDDTNYGHRNTLTMKMHNEFDNDDDDVENDIDLNTEEEEEEEYIDSLLTTKQNLQALLLDDFEEQSMERLEFLLSSIEQGIRGEKRLISEDVIEFMTYLSSTKTNKIRENAIQLFIQTFDNKFETISHNGELRRPQIGDLLIDAFTDLVMIIVTEIDDNHQANREEELQQHAHNIMKLLSITSQICVLRHGFTRLFALYNWCLSSNTKTDAKISMSSPKTPRQLPPKPFKMRLALLCLDILEQCITLNGPEIYLSVHTNDHLSYNGLHPMVPIKSRLNKGWSFTSWIRLKKEQSVGVAQNVLSFEGFLNISIQCKGNETCSLLINNAIKIETLSIVFGRWHFLCFSHNKNLSTKQDNFMVFIDGKYCNGLQIQYPSFASSNNNGIFPLHLGGFCGAMGQTFVYELAINHSTVTPLFCAGATYNPPIYNRSGATNNHFDRIAAFPRNVKQRAAPMQPRKNGYLLLPFCYGLNPRAVSEVLCLPYGWGYIDICDRKNDMNIVSRPHNKSSLISMGGICYVFYMLSPEFNGPPMFSDKQAMNVLSFINELITNNLTLLRQLFTMGLTSIKMYILRFIKSQHRSHLILNQIKELLMIITNCDPTQTKQQFVDGFVNIILDSNYWIKSPHSVQIAVAQYIHTLIQTQPNEMSSCLSLSDIFDMIRSFHPISTQVPNNIEIARKLLESAAALIRMRPNQSITYSSHRSISMLINQCDGSSLDLQSLLLSTYSEMAHHASDLIFSQMASKCGFVKVLWDILHSKIEKTDHGEDRDYIITELRVKAAKITMGFVNHQRKAAHSSISSQTPFGLGLVNKSSLDEVIYGVGLCLGSLPPSLPSYSTLLEIVLGKYKLITPSSHRNIHQFDTMHALVKDKDEVSMVLALEGLMKLISVSNYKMRTRMLMDVLSLVKTSDYNQKLFCRQRNSWDKWMVNLISLETNNDDESACNQLVSQIAATIVWRFLIKDDKGWISVMHLLESLNRKILQLIRDDKAQQQQKQNETVSSKVSTANISQDTKLKCRILHEFLIQVLVLVLNRFLMDQLRSDPDKNKHTNNNKMNDLSDSSEHIKSRISKNLISILDITEWALFNHRFSMLSIPRIRLKQDAKETDITSEMLFETRDHEVAYNAEQISNEISCLQRLLSCSLKFISFKNERQLVLRRLLRYLKEILPHKACHLVFDDVINAAREFCNRLQIRHNHTHKHHKKHQHNKSRISIKSENNMKTMRIAYSFLKNAYLRYSRRGDSKKSSKIRALQEEVYAFWGPLLFEDKVDPNTANQMNLPLISAEESLENTQHHIHSLWVFLQHQKWWEYQFQDKNMKKFKSEYVNHDKEEKKKKLNNKEQFDKYYHQCALSFDVINNAETERITQSMQVKRKKKREVTRDLKKYMDFFDEDFQCRFPNKFTPDFWELDPRESAHHHTRLLLVRNFKGSQHSHAAVEKAHGRKRGKSKIKEIQKNLKNDGPRAKLLRQISEGIIDDLKKKKNDNNNNNAEDLTTSISMDSIPETKDAELQTEPLVNDSSNVDCMDDDDDDYDDDALSQSDEDEENTDKYQSANLSGRKILVELEATSISPFYKISGKMYVSEHHLIFEGHDYIENVHEQNAADQIKLTQQRYIREKNTLLTGGSDDALIKQLESENKQQTESILATNKQSDIIEYEIWHLSHIKHLYPRRYLLRENGLEIWIAGTSKSFFFTFKNKRKRGEVISNIVKHSPRFLKSNASKDMLVNPLKMLAHLGLTEKWQKRKISNFDYLMELNVLAGRSYNDITQYPVFPWVITDFSSDVLDLSNPQIYRDLSKPIGALNNDRLEIFAQRYQDSLQDTSESFPPFYYGSHYMSAGIALYYLCRMEPFATLYINLHGGRFEIPDRTFYSILNAWDLSLTNMGDVKELIPEMYYLPEFLRNINKFPLGHRSDEFQEEINDVKLPKWAKNSPEEFVRIMKEALESDYVSANLHHWIDLIFGYKQRGDEAIKAHNVFFYLTYAGAVDPDTISDPTIKAATEQQIYHFGQTPNILFPDAHPPRMETKKCQHWLCELSFSSDDDQFTLIEPFKICQFKLVEQPSHLAIIRSGQCLKIFDTTERILSFELPLLAHLDPAQPAKSTQLRNIIDASSNAIPPELPIFELMPPDWSDSIVYQSFVVSANGLYGITGGYLDGSIKVHWLKDGLTLASITGLENGHNDIITCLALDHHSQDMLVSGAKDGSIVHWSAMLRSAKPARTPLIGKPYRLLSIHYDAVRVIAVNSKVGIIVSAADDATIALYSIARKRFVRELLFEGRDSGKYSAIYHEVVLITITDTGYIVIHSIDEGDPYLRVMSINGILIRKIKLKEILFVIKTDSTNKILISGGQMCRLQFRWLHNLQLITEIATMSHLKNLHIKKPKKRRSQTTKCINASSLFNAMHMNNSSDANSKQTMTHSSAWRQQRFPFSSNHLRRGSVSNVLFGQRKSLLTNKKEVGATTKKQKKKSLLESPRISTHFHGRFNSVDSNQILSESRIIDFDLDPDNTYLVVALLNSNINAAELLLYPLPNTRHIHQFDKFVHSSNKVLQTAKNTIWENIIYVIENSDSNTDDEHRWNHSHNVSDHYFKDNLNGSTSLTSSPKGGQLIMETGKHIISKIKEIKGVATNTKNQNDVNTSGAGVISNKINAFKSLWKKQ